MPARPARAANGQFKKATSGSTRAKRVLDVAPAASTSSGDTTSNRSSTEEVSSRNLNTSKSRQVVVVTGASAGIGRAVAHAFARRQATVALLARGDRGLEGATKEVIDAGGSAVPYPLDVSDPDQVVQAAEFIERDAGPIDVWVNVAFASVFAPFDQIAPEEFKRVTEVAYLGYVYGTMAALKYMKPRDRGTIVQVGSALAYRGIPLQSAYCGAKHAIQGFHEALRCELLHEKSNVRVTMV
jgi:NAD(P)-dependent dehydrogenase (short-subunit alcohol dehydrogenase family)